MSLLKSFTNAAIQKVKQIPNLHMLFNPIAETGKLFGKRTEAAFELSDESLAKNIRNTAILNRATLPITSALILGASINSGLTSTAFFGAAAIATQEFCIQLRMSKVLLNERYNRHIKQCIALGLDNNK